MIKEMFLSGFDTKKEIFLVLASPVPTALSSPLNRDENSTNPEAETQSSSSLRQFFRHYPASEPHFLVSHLVAVT